MDRLLIAFFIGIIFESFNWWSCEPIRRRWRRQCNFNCENCRVWDCDKHLCDEQKRKAQKKEDKKNETI